ncbi:MAG: leucine-rich repeat domain-containing protein [Ruminococcaceae bacterium]|nr:leucine-rich repeat domain-containing protein [Oscillospiraceae bacterium]
MFCGSINKSIFRIFAVLLAVMICFGSASAVFAMEGTSEAEIPETEEPEISETPETEEQIVTSGSCGTNLSWSFSGGTLTISGSGAMTDYSNEKSVPWYELRKDILNIVLPEGLTSIGNAAFYECRNILTVSIPNSVTRIGDFAFTYCYGIKMINFGNGIKTIGNESFSNCISVVSLNLPSGLQSIGRKAFYRCETITSLIIPSGVTNIGVSAFAFCKNLVSVDIRARIKEIPALLFKGCEKLSQVKIPDTVESVEDNAFKECENLDTVYYNGSNISPEDLQKELGGEVLVSSGELSDSSSGSSITENGDGSITSEKVEVIEGEDSTVSAKEEVVFIPEAGESEYSETDVTVDIRGESGWEEAAGAVEDIFKNYGTADDGSERHVNIQLYLSGTESISQEFIESIAGKDVTVTITTENGSVWIINGKDIDTAQLFGNYSLAYVLEAGSAELSEKLGAGTSFVLKFLAPAEINAEVLIRIGGSYARQSASLFKGGKNVEKVQSVVVDSEGYAHFYLGSVTEKTEYYIGMNVPGASEEAIIPQNMLAEYGNPEFIEPIKYEITGRSSSWGMNLGQVMSILAAVMVTVMIVVGAVMFFWNKQRLKNGYVPQMDDEDE